MKKKVNTLAMKRKKNQVKRKSKKTDSSDRGDISFTGFDGFNESDRDSLSRDTSEVADYVKMIIYYKVEKPERKVEKDSVYIKVTLSTRTKEDKALINDYLEKHPVEGIQEVKLIINAEKEEDASGMSRQGLVEARRLKNYLINGGVKAEIITIR